MSRMPSRSVMLALLLALLIEHSSTVTYRCDDDQIIVVQNFGNDTIRMHCQKPILCGHKFLKCRYNHLQTYCGGKTNFAAHIQQITPVSPVMHTCCNLMINEDIEIKMHTGNDCFFYDLPDGTSHGVTAEELETQDKEGYTLLKNFDRTPEKFSNFSGYRLRLFLLRHNVRSQLVVKGLERNEVGYRVTICSIQCKNDTIKMAKVINDKKVTNVSGEEPIVIDGNNMNQLKFALQNLTNDGELLLVSWTKWSHKRWSEWSTERKIEYGGIDGRKMKYSRTRIHQIENGQKISKGSEHESGEGHHRGQNKEDSSDCGDDEYSSEQETDNNKENLLGGVDSKKMLHQVRQKPSESGFQDKLENKSNSHKSGVGEKAESSETENKTKSSSKGTEEGEVSRFNIVTDQTTTPVLSTANVMSTFETQSVSTTVSPDISKTSNISSSELQTSYTTTSNTPTTSNISVFEPLQTSHTKTEVVVTTSKVTIQTSHASTSDISTTSAGNNFTAQTIHITTPDISIASTGNNFEDLTSTPVILSTSAENKFEVQTSTPVISTTSVENKIEVQTSTPVTSTTSVENKFEAQTSHTETLDISTRIFTKNFETQTTVTVRPDTVVAEEGSRRSYPVNDPKTEILGTNKSGKDEKEALKKVKSSQVNSDVKQTERKAVISYQPIQAPQPSPLLPPAPQLSSPQPPAPPAVPGNPAQLEQNVPSRCFSADATVYTQNGEKTMKEISVGDFVLVPVSKNQLRYERVEMFYHREPETRAKFVVLETESGRKLRLTELHLLPLGDCKEMHESITDTGDVVEQWLRKSKFAYKARVGDCVFTLTSNDELRADRIVKIGRQYLKGIYSPMTVEGSIVVDGVLASCFSQVESHFSQKLIYDFLIFLYRIVGPFMQSLNEPIQHLPTFIDSMHYLGRYAVPFVKY